jgi:hypothetical protein
MKRIRLYALSLIVIGLMLTSIITVFTVHAPAAQWQGYVKPAFPDYAPSGMPDIDERQDLWGPAPGTYTWCGPVAVANSIWWLDSEHESILNSNPTPPPTNSDHFALVPAFGPWDDHDPRNIDPLVHAFASLMDTDGIISHDGHVGTRWSDLESGIKKYLVAQNMTGLFEVHNKTFPDFGWIDTETQKCQDVEIFLEFYRWTGIWTNTSLGNPSLENGHFLTVAGTNSTINPGELLLSDPLQDAFEAGTALRGGRSPVNHPYPHPTSIHNDTQYVSQDAYQVIQWMGPQPGPYGPGQPVWELVGYLQTLGFDPSWHAFIRASVATSPKQVAQWQGYVKSGYPDYAPSGVPDFDEKQNGWGPGPGTYTWCGPSAAANSLWWLDSEYESVYNAHPTPPPTISDHFNLLTTYNATWDDHDSRNVDPFVHNLAFLMDTDGQRTGDHHIGTRWPDFESGIKQYLVQQGLAGFFEVHNSSFPDYVWIANETQKCQDVEIFLEFYQFTGGGWTNLTITNPSIEFGHFVTVAGVNVTTGELLISDPLQDAFEAGNLSKGRSPAPEPYPHASTAHNDAQFVSQDVYSVAPWMIPPPSPYGGQAVWELVGYLQTLGYDPSFHAFIRAAIATSATGVHDVAVTNVKTSKDGCKPLPTVADNSKVKTNVTVLNKGNFAETFNVTMYANTTAVDTQTVTSLASGSEITLFYTWNTTGWAHGNYTISAYAVPVPGETNTTDNTYTDGVVKVVIPGDINGDGIVDIYDAIMLAGGYNAVPGKPNWNPNADLNGDEIVDIYDAIVLAGHYNQHE